jgi:GMP synthase-like glutamine amidotransferase
LLRVQLIQHSAADAPAAIGPLLDQLGHGVSIVRVDRGDPIPEHPDSDLLMMFGGGISLTSEDLPPWVDAERELIRRYVDQGRRVLGTCLGSQLVASALGATVRRNPQPEVGWHRVVRVADAPTSGVAASLPEQLVAFHWHQDTFAIPPGARRLYESEACRNQAFAIDDHVFGFQFHFEANERTVRTFVAVSKLWRQQADHVQSEPEILDGIDAYLANQNDQLRRFLTAFCAE